ncbi:MAG TPA: alcohol dehydrogenase catalytic domain-containing protein, partial [Gemmataceae bacterium]|nr:alcohol dehydrogenase catalytic domain-containing protein [Gemmataceae bacterium]
CGVCHSDLFVGSLEKLPRTPLTIGHEGIGRVEAIGTGVDGWSAGDRAGITFLGTTCGSCEYCRSGRERYCAKQTNFGYTLDGALAEYAVAPAAALVRAPEGIDAAALAPMCCAGWTALGGVREAGVAAGQSVALFGFGGLGHLALQAARHRGARVAVVDASEEKLEQARAAGADLAVAAETAGRTLLKEWGGVDAAIVLTGSAAAIPQAFKGLKRLGTLALVGLSVSQYELPLVDTVLKGARIVGSYLGSREDLAEVFALTSNGTLRAHIETHAIEDTAEVLDRMRRGQVAGRAVVRF